MNKQEAKKLEEKILTILRKYLKSTDTIIAGISGGPDSVFLLYLLKQLPIKMIIAHVNHRLRKEADRDESFVKNLIDSSAHPSPTTKSLTSLIFESLKSNIKSLSQKYKQGLEETGRKVRYDYFKKLAKKYKAKFIITAHHADDNLETVISNLVRGAGLQGLAGMQNLENSKIPLLRPLLNIPKNQILSYLKFKKIPFRIDKSNNSLVYRRNFIRHKIIPELKKLNPNISDVVAKNSTNIREINDYLKSSAQKWISKNRLDKNGRKFDAKSFRTQPKALQKIILREIYQYHNKNTTNIESKHLGEIMALIQKNIGNKKKKFGELTIGLKNNIITLHAKL